MKWDKAVAKLVKDRDALLTFHGSPTVLASNCPQDSLPPAADRRELPAEHWKHIRTSNPIESTFATVRHRTRQTKSCLSRTTGLAMGFKLMMAAQKTWRKPDGRNRLPEVISGVEFRDGVRHLQTAA